MSSFAADLQDVIMETARPIYQNVSEFFAFTYPTLSVRDLAKDVVWRLAGKNDKAIRQLTLTYGGGKTHTLVTLYHLVNKPEELPDLPTVNDFLQHIQIRPPKTRVAVLAFDKIDEKSGAEAISPDGERKWLRNPWSLLAFQLAGKEGLYIINREDEGAERESPPAQNLLEELLAVPKREGRAVLILLDEVLMYARVKVGEQPSWKGRLSGFFQYLTQAVEKVDGCAMVASLLATEPDRNDELGRELLLEYSNIFRRKQEESVEPVGKDEIAEVLRRRFFAPESLRDRSQFGAQARAAVQAIAELDEQTRRDIRAQEGRFERSYPFHPDLTDIFYTKWTNLKSFQRTRGILRIFALALRDAETWDSGPLIAANVFLGEPQQIGLSQAARELTDIAEKDETESQQSWSGILAGELEKAKTIQNEFAALAQYREIEQAVFATFLHSQPLRALSEAKTRELLTLIGQTRPHRIDIENALRQWAERSWFLDERNLETSRLDEGKLPLAWRLGFHPNLKQIHHTACERITDRDIEDRLIKEIGACKHLTSDLPMGVHLHPLPEVPKDIEDDGDFHFGILGPDAVSRPGAPSAKAQRFLNQKTGPENPRVYRNAVVLAVPSFEGLAAAQNNVKQVLGWSEVEEMLKGQEIDNTRKVRLADEKRAATKKMLDSVRQAYNVFVTVTEKNEIQAFHVVVNGDSLFNAIKKDRNSRILDSPVTAEALLPGSPYDLWREGETARPLKVLAEAFAQFHQLPKMLNRKAILDTMLLGGKHGLFVFRLPRPDKTFQTFWREKPDDVALKEPGLEVVLPEASTLSSFSSALLMPDVLPELWQGEVLILRDVHTYFADGRRVLQQPEGFSYQQEVTIPRAGGDVIDAAIREAVKGKRLWLLAGRGSFLGEDLPEGVLTKDAYLTLPPHPIPITDILPASLPEAWKGQETTAWAIAEALSEKLEKTLPWITVRTVIDGAIIGHQLETTIDSPWPCNYVDAKRVRLLVLPEKTNEDKPEFTYDSNKKPNVHERLPQKWIAGAHLEIGEMQDLNEQLGNLTRAAVGQNLAFHVQIELSSKENQPVPGETVDKVKGLLNEISEKLELRWE